MASHNEKSLLKSRTTSNKTLSGREEQKHECTWTSLPDDIMELITKRLCLKDCLGLREICTPWRDFVANAIANKHCLPLPELPLLVLKYNESSTVFSLRTERLLYPKRPLIDTMQTIQGSVEGWMIVSEYSNVGSPSPSLTIFFFNPTFWTTIEADKDTRVHFKDVEIIDTNMYARTSNSILVWDLQESSDNPPKPKVLAMLPPRPPPVSIVTGNQRFYRGKVFPCLVKDDALGELFLIYMFFNCVYETRHVGYLNIVTKCVAPPEMTRVEVFKLKTSNETNQWIKVDNMGAACCLLAVSSAW
ncbi:uncharacterized protein LOC133292194 [Gastrolobium bilobum]|uniref:uncharacterized protein LOC133292194 n=1 Tax=Gastrolobium bilobum TaxID=150636 RepID=UPI002AB0CFC7|nr:uncharacterized protein LOC133292194 [Gastrolobium bilobum]